MRSGSGTRRLAGILVAAAVGALGGCGKGTQGARVALGKGVFGQYYYVNLVRPVGGTITSSDGRIQCGSGGDLCGDAAGQTRYAWSEIVTLTAAADAAGGYVFQQWGGDCSGAGACTLAAGPDRFVVAVVVKPSGIPAPPPGGSSYGTTFRVDVVKPTGGMVRSTDLQQRIACGTAGSACSALFPWNATAVLHATPDAGYGFATWGGDCDLDGDCVLDTSRSGADKLVVASFAPIGKVGHGFFAPAAVHGPAYLDFLAGVSGARTCTNCHGSSLQGMGIAPACTPCHAAAGWASWQANCSFCHGVRSSESMAGYDVSVRPGLAAPPDDVAGRLSGRNGGATGAHASHLSPNAIANPVACGECHVVPSDLRHVTRTADVAFGPLATSGGAAPAWDAGSLTCASTYCHGATLTGGGLKSPNWTQLDGSARACAACHGAPPPAPHPAGTSCGGCHPGYTGTSANLATHLNGRIDAVSQACGSCHGLPPVANGHPSSSDCGECHSGYTATSVNDGTHVNGVVDVVLTGQSCSQCHGAPPPPPHPPVGDCGRCHPGDAATTVDPATHLDGVVEVVPMTCTTCHGQGDPSVLADAAPPLGVHGETLTSERAVGAHQAHLTGVAGGAVYSAPFECETCHAVPATSPVDLSHISGGAAAVVLSGAGQRQLPASLGSYDASAGSCVTYCHGSTLTGGTDRTPSWTGGLTGCDGCHGLPPSTPAHQGVASSATACNRCHPGVVDAAGQIVFAADGTTRHVNGAVDEDVSHGNQGCARCHAYAMTSAQTYHHVTGDPQVSGGLTVYPSNPTPVVGADKTCVICHADHPLFSPAVNLGGADRGDNLRASIAAVPPGVPDGATVAEAPGPTIASADVGLCTSCHASAQLKDGSGQLGDGSLQSPALDPAAFAASGHSYVVTGSIQGTGNDFTVNCVKCHSSSATQLQDGAYRFALHESPDRRLRAPLGRTSLADDDAQGLCFRCHSRAADDVGGLKKGADPADWYGATGMTPGATGVFAQLQKGMATAAGSTTVTDTLYPKPSAQETPTAPGPPGGSAETGATFVTSTLYLTSDAAVTPPAGYLQTSSSCTTPPCYDTAVLRQNQLSVASSSSQTTVQASTVAASGARYDRLAQFLSPPVATQFTWATGTLAVTLYRSETNASNNCYFRYSAYRWRPSASTATQFVNSANGTTEYPTSAAASSFNMSVNSNVTFSPGDQILVELEVYKNSPTNTASPGCTVQWGNTPADQGRIVLPATSDGTFPEFQATPPQLSGSAWVARSMSPFAPTAANETVAGSGETTTAWAGQLWRRASFVSPPVAAATTLPASPWTLALNASRGGLASGTGYLRYRIYRWDAGGAQGPDIVPWRTSSGALPNGTSLVSMTTPPGAGVALRVGDMIVAEVEVETMNTTTAAANTSSLTFGSTSPSQVMLPGPVTFSYAHGVLAGAGGHDGTSYTKLHRPSPAEETLQFLATRKHVDCSDCHDPHQARRGNQAEAGTATAGTGTTLTDSNESWAPNVWAGYYVDVVSGTGSGGRAQITANTATQLTFAPALGTAPASGSGYRISARSTGGAVTAATATTLTDGQSAVGGAAKAWQPGAFAGWTVTIVLGTGAGQSATVASNTANQLTLAAPWTTVPDATSRYVVSRLPAVMLGSSGVQVAAWGTSSPTNWLAANAFSPAAGTNAPLSDAKAQWQVCFKCHSGANTGLATWKASWTDLAQDFNPGNQSSHPIAAPAGAAAGANSQLTASQLSGGWKPGDLMHCSDCHGNDDATSGASQGPHASAASFILRGPNTRWPFMADGVTRWTISNYTAGQGTRNGLFCLNCHVLTDAGSVHSRSDHSGTACTACHVVLPHGGKVKRLIATVNTPAPYRDPGLTPVLRAYNGGTSDNSTSCSTTCTNHHNAAVTATNSW